MSKRNLGQRPDQAYSIYTAQEGPAKGALNALSENPQVSALHIQQLMAAAVSCRQADTPLVHSSVNVKPRCPHSSQALEVASAVAMFEPVKCWIRRVPLHPRLHQQDEPDSDAATTLCRHFGLQP
jgi:hypothetical protein